MTVMGNKDFHDKPFDAGTLAKLRIFELYAQEWIPVFVSPAKRISTSNEKISNRRREFYRLM